MTNRLFLTKRHNPDMATTTRKQREIEARERLILEVASRMLDERGYLGMTMDHIAQATEYSKGTIYQHFRNKEEMLSALTIETGKMRVEMFDRATLFQGRPRERLAAIGVAVDLFVELWPQHFRAEQLVTAESIRSKVSEERRDDLLQCEESCIAFVSGIARDAIAQGDLTMPEGVPVEAICFGLWSMTYGAYSLIRGKPDLAHLGDVHPRELLRLNQNKFLDGFDWKPLSTEWDYAATRERVLDEVFPDEARQAGLR